MSDEHSPKFEHYSNFKFDERPPTLPLEGFKYLGGKEVGFGSYCATFDLDSKRVIKINTLLNVNAQHGIMAQGDDHMEKVGAKRSGSDLAGLEATKAKLLALAKDKKETYELLGKYVGEYLPRIESFAIVDSPRKEIEHLKNKSMPEELLAQIPHTERALLEVWERVDSDKSFERKTYLGLKRLYEQPAIRAELARFAENALDLLENEGIVLDLCDYGGIRTRWVDTDGSQMTGFLDNLGSIKSYLGSPESSLLLPRNTAIKDDGKLVYYDTYPIHSVDFEDNKKQIDEIRRLVRTRDFAALEQMIIRAGVREENGRQVINFINNERSDIELLVNYLVLLENMGAEI